MSKIEATIEQRINGTIHIQHKMNGWMDECLQFNQYIRLCSIPSNDQTSKFDENFCFKESYKQFFSFFFYRSYFFHVETKINDIVLRVECRYLNNFRSFTVLNIMIFVYDQTGPFIKIRYTSTIRRYQQKHAESTINNDFVETYLHVFSFEVARIDHCYRCLDIKL